MQKGDLLCIGITTWESVIKPCEIQEIISKMAIITHLVIQIHKKQITQKMVMDIGMAVCIVVRGAIIVRVVVVAL